MFQASVKIKSEGDEIESLTSEEEDYDDSDDECVDESDEIDEEDTDKKPTKKRKFQLETCKEDICSINRNKKATVQWLSNGQVIRHTTSSHIIFYLATFY